MDDIIAWLMQHPLSQGAYGFSLLWLCYGLWRWTRCWRGRRPFDQPLWWPMGLALITPLALLRGLGIGWLRFDKELSHLSSLQPWEGLRALQIVRHAAQSFINWSSPWVSASLSLSLMAALLLSFNVLARLHLYLLWQWLWKPSPPKPTQEPVSLEVLQRELREIRQLLEQLKT